MRWDLAALLAASLAASAPTLADYSTNARHTMLCCAAPVCTIAMARILRDGKGDITFAVCPRILHRARDAASVRDARRVGPQEGTRAASGALALTLPLRVPLLAVSGVASMTANPYVRVSAPALFRTRRRTRVGGLVLPAFRSSCRF